MAVAIVCGVALLKPFNLGDDRFADRTNGDVWASHSATLNLAALKEYLKSYGRFVSIVGIGKIGIYVIINARVISNHSYFHVKEIGCLRVVKNQRLHGVGLTFGAKRKVIVTFVECNWLRLAGNASYRFASGYKDLRDRFENQG